VVGLADPADASTVARRHHCSDRHFRRLFQQRVGLSPREYRTLVRRRQALQVLLASPHLTVAEVAGALGYSDHAHLTRDLREHIGAPPSTLRARAGHEAGEGPRAAAEEASLGSVGASARRTASPEDASTGTQELVR
jgi:transcriptional regulator GlxA family with amidase domain